MSFWNTSDNQQVSNTGTFEQEGGNLPPIPEGTQCLAMPEEAKWAEYDGAQYISIRWTVMAPAEYQNRKIFQKLWVLGNNPNHKDPQKQGDTAKKMLAAIDANAGGKLMASGAAPTDETLAMNLCYKQMMLKLGLWEMTTEGGEAKTGNWVKAVAPAGSAQATQAPVQQPQQPQQAPQTSQPQDDGNIPF